MHSHTQPQRILGTVIFVYGCVYSSFCYHVYLVFLSRLIPFLLGSFGPQAFCPGPLVLLYERAHLILRGWEGSAICIEWGWPVVTLWTFPTCVSFTWQWRCCQWGDRQATHHPPPPQSLQPQHRRTWDVAGPPERLQMRKVDLFRVLMWF